jgi:hypothetical protein
LREVRVRLGSEPAELINTGERSFPKQPHCLLELLEVFPAVIAAVNIEHGSVLDDVSKVRLKLLHRRKPQAEGIAYGISGSRGRARPKKYDVVWFGHTRIAALSVFGVKARKSGAIWNGARFFTGDGPLNACQCFGKNGEKLLQRSAGGLLFIVDDASVQHAPRRAKSAVEGPVALLNCNRKFERSPSALASVFERQFGK